MLVYLLLLYASYIIPRRSTQVLHIICIVLWVRPKSVCLNISLLAQRKHLNSSFSACLLQEIVGFVRWLGMRRRAKKVNDILDHLMTKYLIIIIINSL